MTTDRVRVCVDCLRAWWQANPNAEKVTIRDVPRPAPHPGPRCATHHRTKIKKNRERAADLRRAAKFGGMTGSTYRELLAFQGGACGGCGKIPGPKAKRLAVDHDRKVAATCGHPVDQGCHRCIRGLLCYDCNSEILPRVRDDPGRLHRLGSYLQDPPAQRLRKDSSVVKPPYNPAHREEITSPDAGYSIHAKCSCGWKGPQHILGRPLAAVLARELNAHRGTY